MNLETVENLIHHEPGVLLYFWGEHCNVCHALQPKLFEAFDQNFPKIEKIAIDVGEHADIAAHFGVFSIPTAIVFLGGKEFARVSRNVSIPALVERIERPYSILLS
ncbi:thioredoxin family protein [Hydrogenimonas cancrithermarum]|uniref:Thiol reductase thioredoxin n=1 Tax=Hydrogenimonas cancrithermarum TaxID=2993563 RepID=A0ABM8FKD0_9BACT|nr:thioredoxin family protein [Hydrogenimonas cancrithermarum]BDY12123.1 thiol reductase thioredoxin [Hydrogenimonas cancrithermarum]